MQYLELKNLLKSGLLSFPLTDFDNELQFNPAGYHARLEWLMPFGATALFAAGGTGEFSSLTQNEYSQVIKTSLQACKGKMPIIAGAGGPTRVAMEYAQEAERLGAQGVLLLPHYLTEASQAGLIEHVKAICSSIKIGVIVYNRGQCRLTPESLAILADHCPNLIGFKDGLGDIELMVSIKETMGDRFCYVGGLPTAEVFAHAYKAMGCPVYSSAVFNFVPALAMKFYEAFERDDHATTSRLLQEFYLPLIKIRNRNAGYAVSMVKAGATIVGHSAGPVRPPLSDLTPDEFGMLEALIKANQ